MNINTKFAGSLGGLAIAILAATPAWAQTSNVTLYGNFALDIQVRSPGDKSGMDTHRLDSDTSRIGVRGNEYLGNGMNVIFTVESLFEGDTGGGPGLASWESFVGLRGSWGTVKIGQMFSPYDDARGVFDDNSFRSNILNSGTLWANSQNNQVKGGSFDKQFANTIRYESPVIANGLRINASYSMAENDDHGFSGGLSVLYKAYGFNAALVGQYSSGYRYEDIEDFAVTFALAYDLRIVNIAAVYEHLQYEVNTQGDKAKRDFFGLGATFPIGAGSLFGFYGYALDGKGDEAATRAARGAAMPIDFNVGDDTSAQQFIISYQYPLSKRTALWAGYVYIKNDDNADYTFFRGGWRNPDGTSLVTPGTTQQGLSFGIAHFF